MKARYLALATMIATTSFSYAQYGVSDGQWPTHGGDLGVTRYADLDQINAENFAELKVAWTWESLDFKVKPSGRRTRPGPLIATPLMIDGVLFANTSFSQVAAFDAGSGETIWEYDSESWKKGRPANMGFRQRGVAYWADGEDQRIIFPTGDSMLIAVDAKTGKPIESFGRNGQIDMTKGLNQRTRLNTYQCSTPPVIVRDVIVIGSIVFDRPAQQAYVRGDVRGYDVRTGEKLWQFHSIPQEGEFGNDTWENDSWKYTGNTNVWTLMSADEELGFVYLPFGCATNDFYGGHRLGDNLFANSLVCLNAKTGERVWHYQIVHHDVWDYDLPCAPNLIDIVVDGKPIKAVAQMGKTGYCYTFDRVTGEPVWPINEVEVPQSTVPGERTSRTQPIPTKPAPFDTLGLTEQTVIDFTPEIKAEALAIMKQYEHGPIFTPGSLKGTLMIPGDGGGANWMGATWDPETSIIYVPSYTYCVINQLVKPDPSRSDHDYVIKLGRPQGPDGLPLMKPPYSRITAINMNTGEHVWMKPTGEGIENHPRLRGLDIPPTGGGGWARPMTTKTILIVGHGDTLSAWDKATGETIAELKLSDETGQSLGRVTGMPMSYMHQNKQYIAVALSGGKDGSRMVGLALP